jgi:hypothetical protein
MASRVAGPLMPSALTFSPSEKSASASLYWSPLCFAAAENHSPPAAPVQEGLPPGPC